MFVKILFIILSICLISPRLTGVVVYVSSDLNGSSFEYSVTSSDIPTASICAFRKANGIGITNSISVKATGNLPLTYQWQHNGADIPGATADTLFFPSMAAGDFGTYTCVVTTPNGTVESNVVIIRLDSDGDGLPDDWEITNFGDLTKTGPQDSDGDGTSNEQELADGTNPNNAAEARVALTLMNLPGGSVTVDPPAARPLKGSTVTLTASGTEGIFRSWTGSSSVTTSTLTLTMDGDKEIGAIFDELATWGVPGNSLGTIIPPIGLRNVRGVSMGLTNLAFMSADQATGWPINLSRNSGVSGTGGITPITVERSGRLNSSLLPVPTTLGPVVKVASSGHAVALQRDGTVVCWGASGGGRTAVPPGLSEVVDVAASAEGSLALRLDGAVWVWGIFVPVPPAAINHDFRAIAAGAYHGVGLRRDGTVVCWGDNTHGQCNLPPGLTDVVAISAGAYHSLALKSDGTVVAWGRNDVGQATVPATFTKAVAISAAESESGVVYAAPDSVSEPLVCTPTAAIAGIGHPFHFNILAKGSPTAFSARGLPAGLTVNATTGVISGSPTQFGEFRVALEATNAKGTGLEQLSLSVLPPTPLYSWNSLVPPSLVGVVSFDAGYGFSIVALKDGTVRVFNTSDPALTPPVGLSNVVAVAAGQNRVIALKGDGTVISWGSDPDFNAKTPTWLHDAIAIDAGIRNAVALRADGSVAGWGSNAIANAPTGFIKQAVCSSDYAIGLRYDGLVHVWGGSPRDYPPSPPSGLTGVIKLAASNFHSLALKEDGTVVAWGANGFGQLNVPAGLNDAVDVAAGADYSVALRANGQLVRWGRGSEIPLPADVPPGLAVSSQDNHVLMLTQTEPSVAVPHLALPHYQLAPPNFPFSTRIIAQNLPTSFVATGLPGGISVNPATGVISGTPTAPGVYPVSLSATNGSGTATSAVTYIVPGGTSYTTWASQKSLTATSWMDDPDHDGLVNLVEYALDRNPALADAAGATTGPALPGVTDTWGGLAFFRALNRTDLDYAVQQSENMQNWTTISASHAGAPMADTVGGNNTTQLTTSPVEAYVTVKGPDNGAAEQFLRLKITLIE